MIGQRLKELRGKRTQIEIANAIGISRASYSHYENGIREPDNEILSKIADFYQVTVDELLGREGSVHKYIGMLEIIEEAKIALAIKINKENTLSKSENELYKKLINHDGVSTVDIDLFIKARDFLESQKKDERDIAKRMAELQADLASSSGLLFNGEPMSEEAKESLLEAMEFGIRLAKKNNKKYTPKKYRNDSDDE